jgi:uncharacterized protein
MTWIITYTGQAFDLIMPTKAMIQLRDIAHSLAYTCRFNGHCSPFYSVAQHSLHVASLVAPEHRLQALLHDATEAYVGDMVRPLKEILPEFEQIERRIRLAICEWADLPEALPAEVKHADMVALATERRDLLQPHPAEWECLRGIEPDAKKIVPLIPEHVRTHFYHAVKDELARLGRGIER